MVINDRWCESVSVIVVKMYIYQAYGSKTKHIKVDDYYHLYID